MRRVSRGRGQRVNFRILGPVEIQARDGRQATLKAQKIRALLGYLCVNSSKTVPSDKLIEVMWAGTPPRTAATAVQVCVSKLRKQLRGLGFDASTLISTQPRGYRLNLCQLTLDLREFEHMLAEARRIRIGGRVEEASDILAYALSQWRGRALEDLRELPSFETLGRQLDELRFFAHEQRIELEFELGNHKALITEIYSLIDECTTRENLYGYLMVALYRSGRTAEALATYERLRRILLDDLGVEPIPRLRNLHHAILAHAPALEGSIPDLMVARRSPTTNSP